MEVIRNAILPTLALALTMLGISYTACSDTKAEVNNAGPAAELRAQIVQFEMKLNEMKKVHQSHVQQYSNEMGCNSDSKALGLIKHHNDIITHYQQLLDYNKLQLIQSDTSNSVRNKAQLDDLMKNIASLENDAREIKNGFVDFTPEHITK
ncbi:MAG: hypothetical protein HY064_07535 [Bacteroidetes bacterium]|nr:hypothetical protein [Bacteroidota bacterium]